MRKGNVMRRWLLAVFLFFVFYANATGPVDAADLTPISVINTATGSGMMQAPRADFSCPAALYGCDDHMRPRMRLNKDASEFQIADYNCYVNCVKVCEDHGVNNCEEKCKIRCNWQ